MTDTRDLVTKLRGICVSAIRANYAVLGASPLITANEAIQEAADLITALAERIAVLEGILRDIEDCHGMDCIPDADLVARARTALSSGEGE